MWSDTCKPITLAARLETSIPSNERISVLLTLAHFYKFDQLSDQYIEQLEPLLKQSSSLELQHAHFNFIKACKRQTVGDWVGSTAFLEQALEVYLHLQDIRGEIETRIRLSGLHASERRYPYAISLLEQCQELSKQHNVPPICHALVSHQSAITYMMMGFHDLVEFYASQAYAFGCELPLTQEGVTARNAAHLQCAPKWVLARSYAKIGQFEEAVQHAEEGLALVGPTTVPFWQSSLLSVVASGLIGCDKANVAIDRLTATLKDVSPDKSFIYVESYAQLGLAYYAEARYEEAEKELIRAVDHYDELENNGFHRITCLNTLSNIAKATARHDDAIGYLERHVQSLTKHWEHRHDQEISRLTAVHEFTLKKQEADMLRLGNEQLKKSNQLLQKANEEQAELVKIVAHDIYNPLSVILLRAQLASMFIGHQRSDKAIKSIEDISHSAEYISGIVSQLQGMDKADEGCNKNNYHALTLQEMLLTTIERNQPLATAKQIEIAYDLGDPVSLWGDEVSMQQILDNLLSNSIKYSWPNSVVRINVQRRAKRAVIEFIDQGVGMDASELPKLFAKFGRLSSSRPTNRERSTGLGLYIVQKLTRAMHGQISAHSAGLKKGTTFTLELPIHVPTAEPMLELSS